MPIDSIAGMVVAYICDECSRRIAAPEVVKDWTIVRNPKNKKRGVLCPHCSKDTNKLKKMAEKLGY